MNSVPSDQVIEPRPGTDVAPLWSQPLPRGAGLLTVLPAGGCVAGSSTVLTAYSRNAQLIWDVPAPGRYFGGEPVVTPDGAFVRIENDLVITRAVDTGELLGSFTAPLSWGLSVAPWGDLLYSQATPGGIGALRCVTRTGTQRWSVPLDGSGTLVYSPLVLGDVVVIPRWGALWAYDRDGANRWVADNQGVRAPRPDDEGRKPATDPDGGVELFHMPARLDANRALIALRWYTDAGLYVLDGAAPAVTPVALPLPANRPYAVLPHPPTEFRIAGLGPKIDVGQMDWRYPIVSFEPGSRRRLWEHRLPAKAIDLTPAPGGNLIATANPGWKIWRDYGKYGDISKVTFVRCIGPDGAALWTWHAPGPITHLPAVDTDGTVYVGCEQKLWALPTP